MKRLLLFILFPILSYGQVQIGQDIDGEAADDNMGNKVSLSSDGSVLAVGAIRNGDGGNNAGHVRVFRNINGDWIQIGQDIDGEAASNLSGRGLSLSSDGSIVAIGANLNNGNGQSSGHVRVYENVEDTWVQIGEDIDGEAAFDFSGFEVRLSDDGNILAVGAIQNDGNGNNAGHVRVYENVNNSWVQIGQDIDGEDAQDAFGASISLSSDGSIIAIGGPFNSFSASPDTGHVRVFENINGTWSQIGEDINGVFGFGILGTDVSLSSDGTIVAAGAPGGSSVRGRTRIFRNINGSWVQIGQDIEGESISDRSGASISLSSDGTIIAVGAPNNDNNNGENAGHVRIFKNINDTWIQIGQNIEGEAAFQHFEGMGLSLSSDSATVAIGYSRNDGVNGENSGSARVFNLSGILATEDITEISFQLFPNPVSTFVNLQLDPNSILEKVTIYNNLGQVVKEATTPTIDIVDLSKGLYIVQVQTNQGIGSRKLIIE